VLIAGGSKIRKTDLFSGSLNLWGAQINRSFKKSQIKEMVK
jgi:hypothetical protein